MSDCGDEEEKQPVSQGPIDLSALIEDYDPLPPVKVLHSDISHEAGPSPRLSPSWQLSGRKRKLHRSVSDLLSKQFRSPSWQLWGRKRKLHRTGSDHLRKLFRPPPGELSDAQCEQLASELTSNPFYKQLDLSRNSLKESGAELICAALESPGCRLESLRLSDCVLSERCYASLVSALKHSSLRELDLSGNKYQKDSGLKLLSAGLKNTFCRLMTLRLVCCELTESSCASLLSMLENNFRLRELDLSGNCLQDSGVTKLCAGLRTSFRFLETLRISCCSLSENSCSSLASVLKSYYCCLEELDLSLNQLRDSGIKALSVGLESPGCRLKTLRLISCEFSDEGCASLVSALKSRPSNLTELDISGNELHHQGMTLLTEYVKSSHCKLQTLRVDRGRNLITADISTTYAATDLSEGAKEKEVAEGASSSSRHHSAGISDWSLDGGLYREGFLQHFHGSPSYLAGRPKRVESFLPDDKIYELSGHYDSDAKPKIPTHFSTMASGTPGKIKIPSGDSRLKLDPKAAKTKLESFEDKSEVMKGPSRFTPEVLNEGGNISYRFWGPCPGVFQCDLTKLAFRMTGAGKLTYKVVRWDQELLRSAGKTAAGLLFDIKCSEDAVSQLHFPHCETELASLSEALSVVHISDDGMSILKPREITDTHVIVDIPHLSAFGLVWDIIKWFLNIRKQIRGQVLLFRQPTYTRQTRKLNVFLLPDDVPVQEVKGQLDEAEYIVAPSFCHLIRGQTYSLDCPEAYIVPSFAVFDFNYGPNYHPTFEIRLSPSKEGATVKVRDQEKKHVWEYPVELTDLKPASSSAPQPPASEPASPPVPVEEGGRDPSGKNLPSRGEDEEELFSARAEFIARVSTSVLKDLMDELLQKRVINEREKESIPALPRADKAEGLIDMVLRKGNPACRLLIDIFCEVDPFLSAQLKFKLKQK